MGKKTAEQFLDEALGHVESRSIREWALTPRNLPIWEKIAQGALDKAEEPCPRRFAAYVVCVAIGA